MREARPRTATVAPRRRLGPVLVACALLTALFVVLLFPWERLRPATEGALAAATGARATVGELGWGIGWGGPVLEARRVALHWADASTLEVATARLRPAWSLSWLRGQPALHLDLASAAGALRGTLWPGDAPGFAGDLAGVDPMALPLQWFGGSFPPLTGRIDAHVDLASGPDGLPHGRLELEATDGSLVLPDSPVAIPFTRLAGVVSRPEPGGETRLERFLLEGPMADVEASGTLGAAPSVAAAPLAVDVTLRRIDPALAPLLRDFGVRAGGDGAASLHVAGSLARPRFLPR